MFSPHTVSYNSAINFAAGIAPALPLTPGKTNNFFEWAENTSELLSYIYSEEQEQAMQDLVEAVKEEQEYEDDWARNVFKVF